MSVQTVKDTIVDAFERTAAAGSWGSATVGGAWVTSGPGTPTGQALSVAGGRGLVSLDATLDRGGAELPAGARDIEAVFTIGFSAVPPAGIAAQGGLSARATAAGVGSGDFYQCLLQANISGGLSLVIQRSGVVIANGPVHVAATDGPFDPTHRWWIRYRCFGTNPTQLQAKAWRDDAEEPPGWLLSATDFTAGLQARNLLTRMFATRTGSTTIAVSFDNLRVSAVEPGVLIVGEAMVVLDFGGAAVIELDCDSNALEITGNTEDIDTGVFCEPGATEQGRTTYTAVLSQLWSPALYTKLAPHVGQPCVLRFYPDATDTSRYITFDTRYASVPWGRFEVGQRVEVDLALAVLTAPTYVGELA